MSRVLGIDHGDVRIGLALTDALGMFAHPLETIQVREVDAVERIAQVVSEHQVGTAVIGMPYLMDGSEGDAVEKVRAFLDLLKKRLPEVHWVEVDERLTTVTAQEQLHAAGKTIRNSRQVIDQAAAAVILQDYLDAQQGIPLLPDEEE